MNQQNESQKLRRITHHSSNPPLDFTVHLREFLAGMKISTARVAEILEIPEALFERILDGQVEPGVSFALKIAERLSDMFNQQLSVEHFWRRKDSASTPPLFYFHQ